MPTRFFLALTLLLSTSLGVRAEQSTGDENDAKQVTYDEDVKPIFRQHCLNCHNQGEKKGGLALDSYTGTIEGGGSGEVVYDDGDADGSRLWQLVNHDDTPVMPPNQDKLPSEQRAVIRGWIEGGILENSGSTSKVKKQNALAMVATTGGKPDGPVAMPESVPQRVPVSTARPAATTAIATSPWAPLVAIAGQQQIVLYHAETAVLLGVLPFEEGIAQSLAFSRDGQFLIAGGGEHAVHGLVRIYDVTSGETVGRVGDELDTVFAGDANDTMSRVALGGPQRMLRIFAADDGELLFDLKKHTDWIYAVAFSPDGILVASADRSGGLCVWEAETGRLYLDLTGHDGAIHSLAWRDDSNVIASAGEDGTVRLWDVVQGKQIKSVTAHKGGANAVRFDHQGRFVTAGNDKRARLWDPAGNQIREYAPMSEAVLEVAITHDGQRVIYGDWTGEVVSADAESPDQQTNLAANPPSVPVRIKAMTTKLVSMQTELAPLKSKIDIETEQLSVAQRDLDSLQKQLAAIRQAANEAQSQAEQAAAAIQQIDAGLPQRVADSRDGHDLVIAARLKLKQASSNSDYGSDSIDSVATAEEQLAEQLLAIVEQRRQREALGQTVAEKSQAAETRSAAAAELAAKIPAAEQRVAEVQKRFSATQAVHDAVAARLTAAEQLIANLRAEMQ